MAKYLNPCIDCENCFAVKFEDRHIAYCRRFHDPVNNDELPCSVARIDSQFCGVAGIAFKRASQQDELPDIMKSSLESL
jgi:hypothetical protein